MVTQSVGELQQAHKILAEWRYELRPVERGYANRTLYVNFTINTVAANQSPRR
jgi:aldehyde:ferredoxin oxidoreductase